MKTLAASLAAVLALVSAAAFAGKSMTVGKVYPIAEPDTMQEIKQRAGAVDFQKWMRKAPATYSAFQSVTLPRAMETKSRLFDPTFYLPNDIKDATGKLIAPKGLPVNVYKRIKIPFRYIVIGDTPEDLHWLRNVAKPISGDKILLASGNVFHMRKRTGVPVFVLEDRFVERFGLQRIPAIVQQEGTSLRVTEYAVDAKRLKEVKP